MRQHSESNTYLGKDSLARAIGICALGWLGFDFFLLLMMWPARPDNAFTWVTVTLAPLSCLIVAGPIYLLYSLLRSMRLVQMLGKCLERIPLVLRMLLAIAAGTVFLMALSVHGRKMDTSSWPFSNPFAIARWWPT